MYFEAFETEADSRENDSLQKLLSMYPRAVKMILRVSILDAVGQVEVPTRSYKRSEYGQRENTADAFPKDRQAIAGVLSPSKNDDERSSVSHSSP